MKKLLFPVILCFFALTAQAQDATAQAEQLYRSGQYTQALLQYEQALKNSPNNPYLYYNIGNCYFKMGSKGLAAANYYRAFNLRPRDPDIRHNLTLALAGETQGLVPPGMPVALHKALYWFSLSELKGLVYLVGWLLCIGAGLWLLTRKGGKITALLGILFLACAGWFYVRHSWQAQPLAVVAAPVAEVRSGPGQNFPASASIRQGHLVELVDQKDHWQQVIVKSQGLKGWVESTALERI